MQEVSVDELLRTLMDRVRSNGVAVVSDPTFIHTCILHISYFIAVDQNLIQDEVFRRFDMNGDGSISHAELAEVRIHKHTYIHTYRCKHTYIHKYNRSREISFTSVCMYVCARYYCRGCVS